MNMSPAPGASGGDAKLPLRWRRASMADLARPPLQMQNRSAPDLDPLSPVSVKSRNSGIDLFGEDEPAGKNALAPPGRPRRRSVGNCVMDLAGLHSDEAPMRRQTSVASEPDTSSLSPKQPGRRRSTGAVGSDAAAANDAAGDERKRRPRSAAGEAGEASQRRRSVTDASTEPGSPTLPGARSRCLSDASGTGEAATSSRRKKNLAVPEAAAGGDDAPMSRQITPSGESRKPRQQIRPASADAAPTRQASASAPAADGTASKSCGRDALDCGIRWRPDQVHVLKSMELVNLYMARDPGSYKESELGMRVRAMCHHVPGTKKEDMSLNERLAHIPVVMVLASYGSKAVPWVSLVQPALHLYLTGCNIVFVDVPSFGTDISKYLKYGPEVLTNIIEQLEIKKPRTLSWGVGGAVALSAITRNPDTFGETHLVYNFEYPRAKGSIFEEDKCEKMFSWEEKQVWLSYHGDPELGDDEGTVDVNKGFMQMQKRLQGLNKQKKERDKKPFDELLITDHLGARGHAQEIDASKGKHGALSCSMDFMTSMELFFASSPYAFQDTLQKGFVVDKRKPTPAEEAARKKKEELAATAGKIGEGQVDEIMAAVAQRRDKMMKDSAPARKIFAEDSKKIMGAHGNSHGLAIDVDSIVAGAAKRRDKMMTDDKMRKLFAEDCKKVRGECYLPDVGTGSPNLSRQTSTSPVTTSRQVSPFSLSPLDETLPRAIDSARPPLTPPKLDLRLQSPQDPPSRSQSCGSILRAQGAATSPDSSPPISPKDRSSSISGRFKTTCGSVASLFSWNNGQKKLGAEERILIKQ